MTDTSLVEDNKPPKDPNLIENAIMLYRPNPNAEPIDGHRVDAKLFDKDDPKFEAKSEGWFEHDELWAEMDKAAAEKAGEAGKEGDGTGGGEFNL